jgi:hypothetical protein
VVETTLTQPRCCQALALLGLNISHIQLSALLRKVIDPAKAAAAAVLSGGAMQPVERVTFRTLVNEIRASNLDEVTRNRDISCLSPIASARIIDTLSRASYSAGNNSTSLSDMCFSRPALAIALMSVPGARLTEAESVAVAAHAPGLHKEKCITAIYDIIKDRLQKQDATSTRMSIFDIYPAEASASLSVRAGLPPGDADISLSRFCFWLSQLSSNGASCGAIPQTQTLKADTTLVQSTTLDSSDGKVPEGIDDILQEVFDPPVGSMFGSLDPVARSGIRKLCSGAICCPVVDSLLQTNRTSAFVAFAKRLPASFRPSLLGTLSFAGHPFVSLGSHLLDGGFEADPGKIINGKTLSGMKEINSSALSSQGLGTDGLGLTLRLSSILLQAPFEADVGCLPTGGLFSSSQNEKAQFENPGALLRPIGAHSNVSDYKEANIARAGDVVRSSTELKTAVVTLKGCSGIPIPSDADIRNAIIGRFIRVTIVDFISGRGNFASNSSSLDGGPSMQSNARLLSNATAISAGWNSTQEGTWSIPVSPPDYSKLSQSNAEYLSSTASGVINGVATNRVVLRCSTPRKDTRFSSSAPYALFELVMVLSNPQATKRSYEGEEEVTCAWGCIPLSTLSDGSIESPLGSVINVKLFGGIPGASADISSSDYSQKRVTGIVSAITVAFSGAIQQPTLAIQSTLLSKLTNSQRFSLSRLPLSIAIPLVWTSLISSLRQMISEDLAILLARQQTDGRSFPAFSTKPAPHTLLLGSGAGAAVATAISLLNIRGQVGVNTTAGVLVRALEVLRNDANTKGSSSHSKLHADAAALRNILMRVWACTVSANGILDSSVSPTKSLQTLQRSNHSSIEAQLAWSLFRAPPQPGMPFTQVLADPASQLMPLCGMSSSSGTTLWRPLASSEFHANLGALASFGL